MVSNTTKLMYSIIIDAVGMASYFIPALGEASDVIWAPISGLLVYVLYWKTPIATINSLEEYLPFTDFIPTATIAWFLARQKKDLKTPNNNVIDYCKSKYSKQEDIDRCING